MKRYGLIGHPLGHSFSKSYFNEKFARETLDCQYENYDLEDLGLLRPLLQQHPDLKGFNVTIPYKEAILPYLDTLDETAARIKAVNTVKVLEDNTLKGFNTDVIGFEALLDESGFKGHSALVFGTGGASKAVVYVLQKRGIDYHLVSRYANRGDYTYDLLTPKSIERHTLLINTTPLGTFPKTEEAPSIPYEAITPSHTIIDLVYNPEETLFLRRGRLHGALTFNGLTMLYAQAEASWRIWSSNPS